MPVHLREECEYGEVGCLVEGCTEAIKRKDVSGHVEKAHGDSARHLEASEEEEGTKSQTESEEVFYSFCSFGICTKVTQYACPHAGLGCAYKGSLKGSEHIRSCPYESLKGIFGMKMSLLTEQNILLRHRVDTLERTVLTLRREMNGAKNALGPWFRPSYEGGVDEERYFSSSEEGPRDGSAREGMYGRSVAPLEAGTTLEGTLVGLRESMVGLAAGVDAAGRRNEIALTNETLRLGEEMMSVRAQMHGLRMQVHGMMMDRNAAEGYRNYGGIPGSITKL